MKMMLYVATAAMLVSSPAFALGANRNANLKRVTAQTVMQDTGKLTQPEEIVLHDVKRGFTQVTWQATTPNGEYACRSDDMMMQPNCVHLKVQVAKSN